MTQMHTPRTHLLAIVEPTTGGDATIDLARDTVAGGDCVSVLLLVTDRVRRDIDDFARSEDLSAGEAEATALERLADDCRQRIGADVPVTVAFTSAFGVDVRRHIAPSTTAVAVTADLLPDRTLRRLQARTGVTFVVTSASERVAA